jgi:hypothetical protein
MKSNPSSQALLAELRRLTNPAHDIPEGTRTAEGWADEWGISRVHAARLIRRGIKAGKMECAIIPISTVGRGVYPTPHYREKK